MDINYSKMGHPGFAAIVANLPPPLLSFEIAARKCKDMGDASFAAFQFPENLQVLSLETGGLGFSDAGIIAFLERLPASLEKLNLAMDFASWTNEYRERDYDCRDGFWDTLDEAKVAAAFESLHTRLPDLEITQDVVEKIKRA